MADEWNINVTFASPATVGVPRTINLNYPGDDLGGMSWTVHFSDTGAGGTFNPPTALMGDPSSGSPTSVQTQYTPAAPGNVFFDFWEDVAIFSFVYTPPFLVVQAGFDPKKSAAFMQFF